MSQRKRIIFESEFKAEAVRLVLEGRSGSSVARSLDIYPSSLGDWVKQAKVDQATGPAGALTTAETEELRRLRKENRQLKMEREIPKKGGGVVNRSTPQRSSRRKAREIRVHPRVLWLGLSDPRQLGRTDPAPARLN